MAEESQKKPDPKKIGQNAEKKESGEGNRSHRRYYRQRNKKKGDQGPGGAEGDSPASGGQSRPGSGDSKPANEGSDAAPSRRRRSPRSNKAEAPKKERSSTKRRSSSRKRRNRRSPSEPMVETGILVPETDGYVEPEAVYVYEYLIRPAYRDASDYRPDSFSQQFDHREGVERQLSGQYAVQYLPQYPVEGYSEDAPSVQGATEPTVNFAAAIRAFFAENPDTDEETDPLSDLTPDPEI